MIALWHLLRFRGRMLRNTLQEVHSHSRLKISVIGVLVVCLVAGAFYIPLRAFLFLDSLGHLGRVVVDRLMYVLFMGVLMMLVFSGAIISYSTHYRARETRYLFTLPLRHQTIFMIKFFDCIVMSSWAFLFFLVPIVAAYARVRGLGGLFFVILGMLFVPFAVLAASVSCGGMLFLLRFFPHRWYRTAAFIIGAFLLAGLSLMIFQGKAASLRGRQEFLFTLSQVIPHFGFTQWPFSPHYWITEGLLQAEAGNIGQSLFWWLLLCSNALWGATLLYHAAERWYAAAWAHTGYRERMRQYAAGRGLSDRLLRHFAMPGWQRSLCVKDMKTFWRDPMQWSQFTVFFGLLGIYFANLRGLGYEALLPFWKNIISFLNLASTNLTLASLSVRFVFPQFSLEGKRYWILGLAPIRAQDIVRQKYYLHSTIALCISLPLILLSNAMLKVSLGMQVMGVFVVTIMCFSLTSLCLGLGVVFPNLKADNPSEIVSGFGGTLALVLSLLYICLVIGLLSLPVHLFVTQQISDRLFGRLMLVGIASVVILSGVTVKSCLSAAQRALQRMEF